MKKGICLRFAVGICCCLFLAGCGKKPGVYVDGERICDEELAFFQEDASRAVRMKQLQKMAEEAGLADAFSYEEMEAEMEQVNREREKSKAEGGVLYGPEVYTPFSYYQIRMSEYEQQLKNQILQQTGEEELRSWYETHSDRYRQIGAIRARLTVWDGGRITEQREIETDRYQIRGFSEANETLATHLLSLETGETALWIDENGRECELYCLEREADIQESFEEAKGAVMEQYAAEQLNMELERRVQNCQVEDLRDNAERSDAK